MVLLSVRIVARSETDEIDWLSDVGKNQDQKEIIKFHSRGTAKEVQEVGGRYGKQSKVLTSSAAGVVAHHHWENRYPCLGRF